MPNFQHKCLYSLSSLSLTCLSKNYDAYALFHILLVKTNYGEFSNLKRIKKKIEKSSVKPAIGFDREDMKHTIIFL